MNTEEAQKVLDELQGIRPEVLTGEAKKLFEAIMKIADERDLYKSMLEEKNKIIDLIAEKLAEYEFGEMCAEAEIYHIGCPRGDDLDGYMKCIKRYFENKAKEYLKER